MSVDAPKQGRVQARRYFVPYFVLVVGLLSTAFFSYDLWRTAEVANRNTLYYTALGGLLITFVLFILTYLQVLAQVEAERSTAELRVSEAKMRKTLTDRERTEEALRESEERYRELVENANDIVFTLDLEGNVTSVNKAVESIAGYSQAELIGMNITEFLTPGSADIARRMTERKVAGEERTNNEVEARAKDGRIFTLEISSRLILNQGKPVGVQGVARDITTRRQAEEALRQVDQRALSEYERLLEKVANLAQTFGTARDLAVIFGGLKEFALLSVPCDGLFVSLYDPTRDVRIACYGWGDGEEIDTSALPPMPVNFTGPNSRAVRTNQVIITNDYQTETLGHPALLVGADNGLRPQSSLSAPMAVMGRIIGTIEVQTYEKAAYHPEHATAMHMAANLTAVAIENVRLLERESTARASAEESNRLKDEFLATVSHELRTPLTAIYASLDMLHSGMGGELPADARELIGISLKSAERLVRLVNDVLDVEKIESRSMAYHRVPQPLLPLVEQAITATQSYADQYQVEFELNAAAESAVVSVDADRIIQVIVNLLSNAAKFSPAGGAVVHVSVRQLPGAMRVSVKDAGSGIPEAFRDRIFQRFAQVDASDRRQKGGTGLGLNICKSIIEEHQGTIDFVSEAGKGCEFYFDLPLAPCA